MEPKSGIENDLCLFNFGSALVASDSSEASTPVDFEKSSIGNVALFFHCLDMYSSGFFILSIRFFYHHG